MCRDEPPPIGVGLERAYFVAGDDEIQVEREPEPLEGGKRHLPRVVRPEGGHPPGRARADEGVVRPRLRRGVGEGPALVIERDGPERRLELRGVASAVIDQLEDAVALLAGGERPPRALHKGAHLVGHRPEIEGGPDEGVVQVEDAELHGGASIPCYDIYVIMKRRLQLLTACLLLLSAVLAAPPANALSERERLWLVGERAEADGLHGLAKHALARFVDQFRDDPRLPEAVLRLGRALLALGETDAALDQFRRAQGFIPPPGRPMETKFWEGEALFRVKRYAAAAIAYDTVVRSDATSPLAPDALYGYAWTQLELGSSMDAIKAFQDLVETWPDHPLTPSAAFYLGRTLVEEGRAVEAQPYLEAFRWKYPRHKFSPEAQYLLGWSRIKSGDARSGLADLKAFVDAHPNHPQAAAAQRLITQTVARHGEPAEMGKALTALLAEPDPTPEMLYDAALIAGRLGRADAQDAAWKKLAERFSDHALGQRAALELATSAFKGKRWKETVNHAQTAVKSSEATIRAEAWLLAGEAELKLKRWSGAERSFEAVVGMKEADAAVRHRALAGLGLAHEEQRDWSKALKAYEAAAAESDDTTLRDWARERAQFVKGRLGKAPEKKNKSGS